MLIDGTHIGSVNSYLFKDVMASHTIEVIFTRVNVEVPYYTITTITKGNGSIYPSGVISIKEGNDQEFKFHANKGYCIKEVLIDGARKGGVDSYLFKGVMASHTIEVIYTPTKQEVSNSYQIMFDSQGGSHVPPITDVLSGTKFNSFPSPTRDGYTFLGWYKDKGCTIKWEYAIDSITSDIMLYAKWQINEQEITKQFPPETADTSYEGIWLLLLFNSLVYVAYQVHRKFS